MTPPSVPRRSAGLLAPLVLALAAGCATHVAPQSPASPPISRGAVEAVRDLRTQLATVFDAPVMAHGAWGVHVRSLDHGDVLFDRNANRLMMPASNMKILTLAATAERFGWDHTFTTTLETAAPVESGVLRGDLVIKGGGDPTINNRDKRNEAVFDQWAAALRAAGITRIEGRIVGDDDMFDDEGIGPGWAWDYLAAGYAAPSGALQYNENGAQLVVAPGIAAGDPAIVQMSPGTGLTIVNRVRTVAPTPEGARTAVTADRRIDGPVIEISGDIPLGVPPITQTVAVLNPTLYLAQAARDALVARGISVTGEAVDLDDAAAEPANGGAGERRVLHTTASPPLRDVPPAAAVRSCPWSKR